MLLYSLFLCFKTRKVPSDYSEASWITASCLSIIQILVLAIPILVIVGSNNDAFYFVRCAVIFLMSSTVTMLIFLPKIYSVHLKKKEPRVSRFGSAVGSVVSRRDSHQSVDSRIDDLRGSFTNGGGSLVLDKTSSSFVNAPNVDSRHDGVRRPSDKDKLSNSFLTEPANSESPNSSHKVHDGLDKNHINVSDRSVDSA